MSQGFQVTEIPSEVDSKKDISHNKFITKGQKEYETPKRKQSLKDISLLPAKYSSNHCFAFFNSFTILKTSTSIPSYSIVGNKYGKVNLFIMGYFQCARAKPDDPKITTNCWVKDTNNIINCCLHPLNSNYNKDNCIPILSIEKIKEESVNTITKLVSNSIFDLAPDSTSKEILFENLKNIRLSIISSITGKTRYNGKHNFNNNPVPSSGSSSPSLVPVPSQLHSSPLSFSSNSDTSSSTDTVVVSSSVSFFASGSGTCPL
jgi:hypothetical protein